MKIFITRKLPGMAVEKLKKEFNVEINEKDRNLTKEELINKVSTCDGLISMLSDNIDKEVLEEGKNLKVIANYAVGFNNIDVKEANKRGIIVTNTPDVLTDTTADLAFALMIGASRRVVESHEYLVEGKFKEWKPDLFLGHDITGATLGILGAGRIGKALGRKTKGFNMKILYHNRKRDLNFENEMDAKYVSLDELFRESDYLSLHAPLTEETYHIVSYEELNKMKRSAVIINTARGPLIDEKALTSALMENKIFAAGLDVYEFEPSVTQELTKLKNVILTSHIGSASFKTRSEMASMCVNNVYEVLKGNKPLNEVIL